MSERSLGRRSGLPRKIGLSTGAPAIPTSLKKAARENPTLESILNTGRYNCFRCGFKGGSLKSLAKAVGAEYTPKNVEFIKRRPKRVANGGHDVSHVVEAIADAQSRLLKSPAMSYLKQRGITPYTAMMYGLGSRSRQSIYLT